MKTILLCLLVLAGACTAPNPQSCTDGTCTDPAFPYCDADGSFQAHPGTCIAVTCTAGEFEVCKGPSEALRCNATGNDYEPTQCQRGCVDEAGGCVDCVDNSQCANPTPHCSASSHMCERCKINEDCASEVCDEGRGECVDPSTIVYVAPDGSPTGNCGAQTMPCSLERGIARLDQTLKILKIAAGEYAPTQFLIGGSVTVYGQGATVRATLGIADPAQVQVRGLTLQGINCQRDLGQPLVELDRVTIAPAGNVFVFGCIVTIRRSHIVTAGNRAIFLVSDPATSVTVDRTLYENTSTSAGLGIYADGGIQITNSIFRNMPRPIDHPSGNSSISFSTFINSPIQCAAGALTQYTNNIMYAASGDVIIDAATDQCRYSFNVMSTQSTPPSMPFMNRIGDPRFADVANADYHLLAGSPAIDTGNAFPMVTADFDGTPRPQGAQLDIGAFEYKP